MITVNFFTTLRVFLKTKQVRVYDDEITIFELLQHCETQLSKPFLDRLFEKDGNLIPGTMVLVNGQNILHLQGIHTVVRNGSDVALFPAEEN